MVYLFVLPLCLSVRQKKKSGIHPILSMHFITSATLQGKSAYFHIILKDVTIQK